MRNATRAAMGPEHHAGWLQRTAAVIVLVCVVFALLIVLHLL
jgi:succinate dehydrogenase hydrophobic anchor subunit